MGYRLQLLQHIQIHFYGGISAANIHFYEGIIKPAAHFYEGMWAPALSWGLARGTAVSFYTLPYSSALPLILRKNGVNMRRIAQIISAKFGQAAEE